MNWDEILFWCSAVSLLASFCFAALWIVEYAFTAGVPPRGFGLGVVVFSKLIRVTRTSGEGGSGANPHPDLYVFQSPNGDLLMRVQSGIRTVPTPMYLKVTVSETSSGYLVRGRAFVSTTLSSVLSVVAIVGWAILFGSVEEYRSEAWQFVATFSAIVFSVLGVSYFVERRRLMRRLQQRCPWVPGLNI